MRVDGRLVGRIALAPSKGWDRALDRAARGPPGRRSSSALTPSGGDWLDCHVWILGRGEGLLGGG